MPTYVAFGKDFGVTVDAKVEDVVSELSAAPPGKFVFFQGTQEPSGPEGTQQQSVYGFFLNGGNACWVVSSPPPSSSPPT